MAKTRALFIGNSFTARNDLPGLVAQLVSPPPAKANWSTS